MSGTTIAGSKFSDQTAALLGWAAGQEGWRVEPNTRGRGGKALLNSVIVYPADKDQSPVAVNERGGKFNKAHYENLRRELYAVGLPPLPADSGGLTAVSAHSLEEAREMTGVEPLGAVGLEDLLQNSWAGQAHAASGDRTVDGKPLRKSDSVGDARIDRILRNPESAGPMTGALLEGVLRGTGLLGRAEADLISMIAANMTTWFVSHGGDQAAAIAEGALTMARTEFEREISEALAIAAEHEATAARATEALTKAEARETQARTDCAAALRRAETAEAAQHAAEAALAPLRAYLGNS